MFARHKDDRELIEDMAVRAVGLATVRRVRALQPLRGRGARDRRQRSARRSRRALTRLVVDASALVSGIIGAEDRPPALLLDAIFDRAFEAVICPRVLAEVQRTLTRPYLPGALLAAGSRPDAALPGSGVRSAARSERSA